MILPPESDATITRFLIMMLLAIHFLLLTYVMEILISELFCLPHVWFLVPEFALLSRFL